MRTHAVLTAMLTGITCVWTLTPAQGAAIDPGHWLLATAGGTVYHYEENGTFIESYSTGDNTGGLGFDGAGNAYSLDRGKVVTKFPQSDFASQSDVITSNLGTDDTTQMSVRPGGRIYTGNKSPQSIFEHDEAFSFVGIFDAIGVNANDQEWGPDGRLYLAGNDGKVRVTDGTTLANFISGLTEVNGLEFDSNGVLYVSDGSLNEVRRFQGPFGASPGAAIDTFVSAGSGGLSAAGDCEIGRDGDLYVVSIGSDHVKRYDGTTGAYVSDFITLSGSEVPIPLEQAPTPDPINIGDWFVGTVEGNVFRYDENGNRIDFIYTGGNVTGLGVNNDRTAFAGNRSDEAWEFPQANFGSASNAFNGVNGGDQVTHMAVHPTSGNLFFGNKDPGVDQWDSSFVAQGQYVNLAGHANPNNLEWGPDGFLWVGGNDWKVRKWDGTTVQQIVNDGEGTHQNEITGIAFGPDGNLYAADAVKKNINYYQGPFGASPGTHIGVFVAAASGGLDTPMDIHFGNDGNLYVVDQPNDVVKKYNGTTGAFIENFITLPASQTAFPLGQAPAPDPIEIGDWLVGTVEGPVYRYDVDGNPIDFVDTGGNVTGLAFNDNTNAFGVTRDDNAWQFPLADFGGASIVIASGVGGGDDTTWMAVRPSIGDLFVGNKNLEVLQWDSSFVAQGQYVDLTGEAVPGDMEWGPDGALYIGGNDWKVRRYDGSLTQFVNDGEGTHQNEITGIDFGPDGNLYVADAVKKNINRYNGSSGAHIDVFVAAAAGGLDTPLDIHFGNDGNLYVVDLPNDVIKKYNGSTGAFIENFATIPAERTAIPLAQAYVPPPPAVGTMVTLQ